MLLLISWNLEGELERTQGYCSRALPARARDFLCCAGGGGGWLCTHIQQPFLAWERGEQLQEKIRKIKTKLIVWETRIKPAVLYL